MRRLVSTVSYLGLAFGIINTAQAQNCKQVPSCASLGYDRAAGDCPAGVTVLTCPFDSNYIYCPEDCRLYPLSQSQCDSIKGTCIQCGKSDYWKYESCNDGWYLGNDDCVENECGSYPSTSSSITGCSTTSSCQKGSSTVYKCTTCASGYAVSSGTCAVNPCTGYNLSSCPSYADCATCKSETTTKYKITGCSDSCYYWNGSSCVCSGTYDVCYMQNCTIYNYGGYGYSVYDNGKEWDWNQSCVGVCNPSDSCASD